MTLKLVTVPALVVFSSLWFACAAQPQQPAPHSAPAPPPPTSTQPVAPTPEPSAAPAESAPVAAASTPEPEPVAAPAPLFSPLEVLTGPQTAFLIDYTNSSAKERAETLCNNQANETKEHDTVDQNREKVTSCLAKERAKFTADILRFRKDDRGNGTLTVYRRNSSALAEVYVAKVKYKETGKDSVKVIVTGGMSGARPICRDRQDLDVKVPNGYSIELDDSVYGKLTYDAKIGLVDK